MASITLKDIPDTIHRAIKKRAKRTGRSLNREVLEILTNAVKPQKIDVDSFLDEVRRDRESIPGQLSDELLRKARTTGRP